LNVESESETQSGARHLSIFGTVPDRRARRVGISITRAVWRELAVVFSPVHPIGVDGRHLSAADINNRNVALGFPNPNATTWLWNWRLARRGCELCLRLRQSVCREEFLRDRAAHVEGKHSRRALQEFQDFVAAADNGGANTVNVMLDSPFNHTSFDVELGAKA
jgi:hypothetical protein